MSVVELLADVVGDLVEDGGGDRGDPASDSPDLGREFRSPPSDNNGGQCETDDDPGENTLRQKPVIPPLSL
jgi:hypothetical protein